MKKTKKHHGEILFEAIKRSHIPKTKIASLIKCSQRHMYNLFEKPELPMDIFLKVGKVIGYDFSLEIPEITNYTMMTEPQVAFDTNSAYQKKYFELLEKHVLLIEQLNALKEKSK